MTNTDQNYFSNALKWEIMDAYLKLPYRNHSKVSLGFYKKNAIQHDSIDNKLKDSSAVHFKTKLPLQSYTGRYFNDVYGNIEIVVDSGNLKIKFSHHPNMHAALQSLGGNRFYAFFSVLMLGKNFPI